MANISVEYVDQTDESDLNFLTRLDERHDSIAAIKSGKRLFTPRGQAETANGNTIPVLNITPGSGDRYRFIEKERDEYTGVVAFYDDLEAGKQKQVLAGSGGRVKRLRGTYANHTEADAAAWAEIKRLSRGEAEFSITLAVGRPEVGPECQVSIGSLKPEINYRLWVVTRASHSLSENGLKTSISAENLVQNSYD